MLRIVLQFYFYFSFNVSCQLEHTSLGCDKCFWSSSKLWSDILAPRRISSSHFGAKCDHSWTTPSEFLLKDQIRRNLNDSTLFYRRWQTHLNMSNLNPKNKCTMDTNAIELEPCCSHLVLCMKENTIDFLQNVGVGNLL